MRVKVESPKELGSSYTKGDILEVAEDRAQRWKEQGLVSYVDANSPDSKKPTKAEVEEEPRGGDAAPVLTVHPGDGTDDDPAHVTRKEGQKVEEIGPDTKDHDQALAAQERAEQSGEVEGSGPQARKSADEKPSKPATLDPKPAAKPTKAEPKKADSPLKPDPKKSGKK